jgi:hypothetical protein
VEWIGRSIGGRVEFFPRAVFFPNVQVKTGLTGFLNRSDRFRPVGYREGFWARKSLLLYGFFFSDVERFLWCFGSLGCFWTKSVWPVCQTGLTGFPCLHEAKSNRSGLTGLVPRSSSTSVAMWTWKEKLAELHEWNRVHRLNSWIEFLSALIHSPLSLVRRIGPS